MSRLLPVALVITALLTAACKSTSHPALLPPDGVSHRGDRMVGRDLKEKDVAKLGRLYRESKGFEERQEYFLRLLDYFWFSQRRIVGMKRSQIVQVFGPGQPLVTAQNRDRKEFRLVWNGGRDSFLVDFDENEIAYSAFYVQGY